MEAGTIIRLIETVSASSLSEFEYQEGDVRPVLKAEKQVVTAVPAAAAPAAGTRFDRGNSVVDDGTLIKSPRLWGHSTAHRRRMHRRLCRRLTLRKRTGDRDHRDHG